MSEDRKMYPCACSDCGKGFEVPFKPKVEDFRLVSFD
jgi:hypothetical protein